MTSPVTSPMASPAQLLAARPRLRSDAMVGPAQQRGAARIHLVRAGGTSLELGVKEHFVIARLDGTRSLAEIGAAYQAEFGKTLGPANWGRILGTLHRRALLAGDTGTGDTGTGARATPPVAQADPALRQRTSEPFIGRPIRVVRRPEALLDAILRPARPVLSVWVVVPLTVAVVAMVALLASRLDLLVQQTGSLLHQPGPLLAIGGLAWVAAALHELAHGVAARRYGVGVEEIGVRWVPPLVLPYCRTDSYLHLPRRSSHVAIAAAGVLLELALLLPVAVVWWRSPGGATGEVLGALLFVLTAHTLVNLLPLPPLDGYKMIGHALALTDYARHTLAFAVLLARRDPLVARYPVWVRLCYAAYGVVWSGLAVGTIGLLLLTAQALTGSWLLAGGALAALVVVTGLARWYGARRAARAGAGRLAVPVGGAGTAGGARVAVPVAGRHRAGGPAGAKRQRGSGPALELVGVVKSYGERSAVDGVTLRVAPGEFLGLIGPNGAGKTTLVEIAVGLRRADAGTVSVLGASPWPRSTAVLSHLGVQTQTAAFFVRQTAREHLRTVAALYGYGPAAVVKALRLVGLEQAAEVRVERLSGGQQQRLAIAAAFVHDPEMVFLDEPTAALDPQARRELWAVLRSLHATGRTVVYTTHHLDEAEALCDRVAVMSGGRIAANGAPYRLIDDADLPTRLVVPRRALAPEQAASLPGVLAATREGPAVVVETRDPDAVRPSLEALVGRGAVQTRTPTLEDVYLELIGSRALG